MSLLHPALLALVLLVPLLFLGAWLTSRHRGRQWDVFMAPRLRPFLLRRASGWPRWTSLSLLLAALVCLIIALARPQGDGGTQTQTVVGRNVMIALDLSRSMRVTDLNPDRLGQAKVLIYEMMEALPNDRIGLIGFAGRPVLFAPLTTDHTAVRETVEQMDETWVPYGGSNLAAAVALAIETVKETGQKTNALVLISDGEENSGELQELVRQAESAGLYVFAIGVGTSDGGFVPNEDFPGGRMLDRAGRPVLSRLQPGSMRELATETGGRFLTAGAGLDIPQMVQAAVQDLDSFELEGRERRVVIEFYQWLLLPAILLMLVSVVAGTCWRAPARAKSQVRSRSARSIPSAAGVVVAAALILLPTPVRADLAASAADALAQGRYEDAQRDFRKAASSARTNDRRTRLKLGEGTAAYHAEDFLKARSALSAALLNKNPEVRAGAHTTLGNTLFQLGWTDLTGESYPQDPTAMPDLNRFDTLARERLARMLADESSEAGNSTAYARIEALILNWADAVHHFDATLEVSPNDGTATRNRATTLAFMKRLVDLLRQENEQTEQMLPEEVPQEGGESQPPPEGSEGEPSEEEGEEQAPGESESDQPQEGEPGENVPPPDDDDGSGEQGEPSQTPPDSSGDQNDDDDTEADAAGEQPDPSETPEERARRILRENADLERGAPSPGRFEFRDPEKDW